MLAILDFLPLIAFGGAYWLADFRTAVMVIMAAMVIQLAVTWVLTRKVNKLLLGSTVLVVGLGGISLALRNDLIFKWKPTVLNLVFAAVFLGSQYIGERPVIQRLLQSVAKEELHLTKPEWRALNQMWIAYFVAGAIANIYVAYNFSEATWVKFKVFGLIGLTVAFVFAQAWWLAHRPGMIQAGPENGGP